MRRLGQNCSSTARSMRISLPVARSAGKGFNRSGARQRGEPPAGPAGAVRTTGSDDHYPGGCHGAGDLALEHGQGGVVQQPVGGQCGAAVESRYPVQVGEPAAGLLDQHLHGGHIPGTDNRFGG